ncbi:MAG: PAS domain S-box protein [Bacteroidetes bacterium]|nr:PAS domain S-box protein [Bacteroidota bacterium]
MNSSEKIIETLNHQSKPFGFTDEFSVLLDKNDCIIKVSPTFCKITGHHESQLKGRQISDYLDFEPSQNPAGIQEGQNILLSSKLKNQNGSSQHFQIEISRQNDVDKLYIGRTIHEKTLMHGDMATEELLYLFVKHSPAALAMLDNDMNYIITSDRWIKDYNLDTFDLGGRNHYEVFKGIPDRWKEIHKRCLSGVVEKSDEDYFEDNNGNLVWNRWEIHPWHKLNGEIGGILMFTEVITRTKEAEMKFSDLSKNPLVGVFILQNGQMAFANDSLCKTLGYTDEALKAIPDFKQIIHPDDVKLVTEPVEKGMQLNSFDIHIEFRCFHKNGATIWVELYASKTIYNSKPALIGTLTDISERKHRENRAERQIELFKELSFIISHQLRHEYVKLNGLVNLINLYKEQDDQWNKLLKEGLVSFNKIDEYIFTLNDKLEKLNQEQTD